MKKFLKVLGVIILFLAVAGIAAVAAFNIHTISVAEEYILDVSDFEESYVDYIMVLGCSVRPDGTPSDMLHDRVITGAKLYNMGVGSKLLLTGDSEEPDDYDETMAMKKLSSKEGISAVNQIVDPVGLSTYDSIKRAAEQLEGKSVIIVTQEYHLYRAVYIARSLGLDAYGCKADIRTYRGQFMREIREWAGRVKDELYLAFDLNSKYGTEVEIL